MRRWRSGARITRKGMRDGVYAHDEQNSINHVPRGPKNAVNLTLSEDLVREIRQLTHNLLQSVGTLRP
jgi:hypothetical protein